MDLQHLTISRAALFDIPEDGPANAVAVPTGGQALIALDAGTKTMVTKRLAAALGKNANGVELSITDHSANSFFQIACQAIDGNDAGFLAAAHSIASLLAKAQHNKHLAHSKLIILQGTVTAGQLPYLMVVKAELQDGLSDGTNATKPKLQHLTDIFMTESQRLFKIGFLFRAVAKATKSGGVYSPADHKIHLFDHLMTATETRNAAFYFYNVLLGCNTATSARARTRDFYENTLEFIKSSGLSYDEKMDLREALRTELKSSSNTLNVTAFSKAHVPVPVRKQFEDFMIKQKSFPNHAVTKDIDYVKAKLKRRRRIRFSSGIDLSCPPEIMGQIKVSPTGADGTTTIVIPGKEESRE